jgi:hypothetical protein
MATCIETVVGDVLILFTDPVSHLYAVGPVTTDGQQAFLESRQPIYASDPTAASAMVKAMVKPGRRILIRDVSDSEWSALSHSSVATTMRDADRRMLIPMRRVRVIAPVAGGVPAGHRETVMATRLASILPPAR